VFKDEQFVAAGEALAAIHEFHRICERRERTGGATLDEARLLFDILDRFEPMRICNLGVFRKAVHVEVRGRGALRADAREQRFELVRISLRAFEIVAKAPLDAGAYVRLSVAPSSGDPPLIFSGRVASFDPETSRATVLLNPARLPARHPQHRERRCDAASGAIRLRSRPRRAWRLAAAAAAVAALVVIAMRSVGHDDPSPQPTRVAASEPPIPPPIPPTTQAMRDFDQPFVR
jgi:hypothetical protein